MYMEMIQSDIVVYGVIRNIDGQKFGSSMDRMLAIHTYIVACFGTLLRICATNAYLGVWCGVDGRLFLSLVYS